MNVIIPVFNRPQYIERAIQSVLQQTYQQLTLTIVDDGSTDETVDILKKYIGHPKVNILTQTNSGVSSARNKGVMSLDTRWISFLDSDDEWLPRKLEKQMKYLEEYPHFRFIHSEENWFRNGVKVNPKLKHSKSAPNLFSRSLEGCLISPSTVVMRKDLFLEKGSFNESFVVCEDYDLWLKVMATEKIAFHPEYLVNKYGGHADQLSMKYPAMDYWRIKSLVNLLTLSIDENRRSLIIKEIEKKTPILLRGFQKHENKIQHDEILELTRDLFKA
ncbi:MAG: glycosyltransferase family 2 protein [Bacteriovoracaceae bacterium]